MFMPADWTWLEPVLVAAAIVFVIDLIGNMLHFSNRVVNALVTSIVFAVVFGTISFYLVNGGKWPTSPTSAPIAAPDKV
ncbi:MAG: hypothetical protein NW216_03325 [Hyphomicrobium sp.]|nr:hypothetical protein [Hyphomicrobium sp.]